MKNLLIVCGGQSPEHLISIRSTKSILAVINRSKYTLTIIGISREGHWKLIDENEINEEITIQGLPVSIHLGEEQCFFCEGKLLKKFDVVFPVLHGSNGEDGTIQGVFRLCKIPFVGSDILASAVSLDKDITKKLLRDSKINVVDWVLLRQGDTIPLYSAIQKHLGQVVVVKPANSGSSVGVHRVTNEEEWGYAIEDSLKYDRKVLIEKNIIGREFECAILGNENPQATGVGEIRLVDFYSYKEKYDSSSQAAIIIPAQIDSYYLSRMKDVALKTYKALDCEGMARVDMFLTDAGELFVNEINTIPGFTSISMYPKLWESEGLAYSDLIDRLIELTMEKEVRDKS